MFENSLITHKVMMPPRAAGTIAYIAEKGNYHIDVRGREGRRERGGEGKRERGGEDGICMVWSVEEGVCVMVSEV